jgi:hypothetical protein
MEIVISLTNIEGTKEDYFKTNNNFILTAIFGNMDDILETPVRYFHQMQAYIYYQRALEDDDKETNTLDETYEYIECPSISKAIEDIMYRINHIRTTVNNMNRNLAEENKYIFDPKIVVLCEGALGKEIISRVNKQLTDYELELEALDILEYMDISTLKDLDKKLRISLNLSHVYPTDSLCMGYIIWNYINL